MNATPSQLSARHREVVSEAVGSRHWLEVNTHSMDSTGVVGFCLEGEEDNRRYSAVFFIHRPVAKCRGKGWK